MLTLVYNYLSKIRSNNSTQQQERDLKKILDDLNTEDDEFKCQQEEKKRVEQLKLEQQLKQKECFKKTGKFLFKKNF